MATRKPRSKGGGSQRKSRPSSPFPIPKVTRETEGGVKKTVYKVAIPKALRDDPKKIAKYLREVVKQHHGEGGKAYRDQHFMMTYSGQTFSDDDPDSEREGKKTFGTYANRNLGTVANDLASRIQSLLEGNTPRTLGQPGGGSDVFFALGVSEVSAIVMEKQAAPKKRKHKK